MSEFTNEHHEILFKLFIIESNGDSYDNNVITQIIFNSYLYWKDNFQFNDRAICEPSLTRSEFNSRLHSFRLKHTSWNWDKDFTPHMWIEE